MFGLLSILIANVYPVIASFKAFEEYGQAKKTFEKSNLNIGGFNVPINSLIKKATGDNSDDAASNEALMLVYQHNKLQKWFIYWIVKTSIDLLSTVLLLRYIIPFYSLVRLALSIWLLSPMFKLTSIHNFNEVDDLNNFFQSGCGYIYSNFLKLWLNGDLPIVSDLSFDTDILNTNVANIVSFVVNLIQNFPLLNSLLQLANININPSDKSGTSNDYGDSIRNFSGGIKLQDYFKSNPINNKSGSTPEVKPEVVDDDYDVIDPPLTTESTAIDSKAADGLTPTKKGWFW